MMLIIAFSYAEVSSSIPASGGIVRYPHMTHGRLVGFTMSWIYLISAVSTVAIEAVAATTYLSHFFPSLYDNGLSTSGIVLTYVLLVVFFLANYFGVKLLGRVSHGLGWWKLLIPTITSILLFLDFNQSNFAYILPNNLAGPGGIDGILFAIPSSGIIFSYLGFRQAIEYGGEGRNPQRDIPFALVSSIAIAMLIFTMLQLGFIGALNWNVAGLPYGDWSGLLTSSISDSPIISLFQEASILSYVWVSILAFDAVFSPSGTGIIYTGTTARTFMPLQ
ncbi:APC family permease [Sulfuracidifex metallicus]|uniref:APC family permease n=1 Tax=Sulfuracidifex metallicus TaxID=47303 RepID=UPI000ABFEC49|nr:APC family permease [Sulfuracidifex metallicus]